MSYHLTFLRFCLSLMVFLGTNLLAQTVTVPSNAEALKLIKQAGPFTYNIAVRAINEHPSDATVSRLKRLASGNYVILKQVGLALTAEPTSTTDNYVVAVRSNTQNASMYLALGLLDITALKKVSASQTRLNTITVQASAILTDISPPGKSMGLKKGSPYTITQDFVVTGDGWDISPESEYELQLSHFSQSHYGTGAERSLRFRKAFPDNVIGSWTRHAKKEEKQHRYTFTADKRYEFYDAKKQTTETGTFRVLDNKEGLHLFPKGARGYRLYIRGASRFIETDDEIRIGTGSTTVYPYTRAGSAEVKTANDVAALAELRPFLIGTWRTSNNKRVWTFTEDHCDLELNKRRNQEVVSGPWELRFHEKGYVQIYVNPGPDELLFQLGVKPDRIKEGELSVLLDILYKVE